VFTSSFLVYSQDNSIDKSKIKEDLALIIENIEHEYAYFKDKKVDLACLTNYYGSEIDNLKNEDDVVLFFEFLLNELHDSHVMLQTNIASSYRLFSPVFTLTENGKTTISNTWQTQIENIDIALIGAEIQKINDLDFQEAINNFPTHCDDKTSEEIRTWIGNKVISGRYNEKRILTLKLANGETTQFDMDTIKVKKTNDLLTTRVIKDIGIIRINNTLGQNTLISEFDAALDGLMATKGLVLDLRNTVDGGNSYVARGIMSRFIKNKAPYQKHLIVERYDNQPTIERSWIEYVTPRGTKAHSTAYDKPVVILVGKWTGSMGEGLAIGFEGMKRGEVFGTEMERLAGEMNGFSFKHQYFGYRISTAKLFHLNGVAREKYVPTNYVKQTQTNTDEALEGTINILQNKVSK